MAVLVEGSERTSFTTEQKKKFNLDIQFEKKNLMLRAGAGDPKNSKTDVKAKMWSMLQEQEFKGKRLEYAPFKIAVNAAMVWSAPNVELEF